MGGAERKTGSAMAWVVGYTDAVGDLAANPNRPISAAWATSVLDVRMRNPHFVDLLDRFHAVNPGATPSEALRRSLSAEQDAILAAQDAGDFPFPVYPSEHYTDPKAWPEVYRWLRQNQQGYGNRYFTNLVQRELATAVSQRTIAMRFLGRVLPHIVGEEPQWANCGCSDMSGDRRNWLSDRDEQFRYGTVGVEEEQALGGLVVSRFMSDIFNDIVSEPDDTRRVVGLDRNDPELPENIAWRRACSTPEEIWSGVWDDLHDRLMLADVPGSWLGFQLADFSRRADARRVVEEEGQFDGVAALFSWYQGSAEIRRRKLKNMREVLLRAGGLLVIADFARTVARGTYLMPEDIWGRPTIYANDGDRLVPVLSAGNGRFERVRVLPGLIGLAEGGPHAEDVRRLAGD